MPDTPHLRPATADEIADALSFALRYQGRKRVCCRTRLTSRLFCQPGVSFPLPPRLFYPAALMKISDSSGRCAPHGSAILAAKRFRQSSECMRSGAGIGIAGPCSCIRRWTLDKLRLG
jgi:hypothetical protein